MKTHPAMERPPDGGENPQPLELANFIFWKFLQMPAGGLYAKWDTENNQAVWFYSAERDYMFREPRRDTIIYEEHDRIRFRSLVFRFGSLCGDELCGYFEFQRSGADPRRYAVHSCFYPEIGMGLWVAITSRDEPDGAANRGQPIGAEINRTSVTAGSDR